MENTNQNKVTNTQEITCVVDFLNVLKNDVEELDLNKERFFRGLNKSKYIKTDSPSIYRSPDNNPIYEPYIKYEHEMYYDLISRFPEQFSSCKNTFEHLVMMQHYEFPTRLLDVTSNPLVALYFACVNHYGNVNKEENGAVLIYDIPNKQIKNYNSDTVTILSNLARIDEEYRPVFATYNRIHMYAKEIKSEDIKSIIREMFIELPKDDLFTLYEQLKVISNDIYDRKVKQAQILNKMASPDNNKLKKNIESTLKLLKKEVDVKQKKLEDFKNIIEKTEQFIFDTNTKNKIKEINSIIQKIEDIIVGIINKKTDLKFKHLILEEKPHFVHENINPNNLNSFFCVKPKLNNPRIISQNGAFLLFGFANLTETKIAPPKQHFQFKAAKKGSRGNHKINIIIKGKYKLKIVSELKQLGIHRASLFPEIDKVAQIVLSEYKIKTNDDPKTN